MFLELMSSAQNGELILVDDGFCRYHVGRKGAKNGVLVIYEILSLRPGVGTILLDRLKHMVISNNLRAIQARCPLPYASNVWWEKKGFKRIDRLIPIDDDGTLTINVWEWKP